MGAEIDGRRGNTQRSALVPALTIGAGVLLVLLLVGIAAQLRGRGDNTAAVAPSPSPGAGPTRTTIVIGAATAGTGTTPAASPRTGAGTGPTTAPAPAQTPATAARRFFTVTGTEGEGIRLRNEPATSGTQLAVYPEGERLEQIGPDREGDGRTWLSVRGPDGNEGFVAAEFTTPAP